MWQINAPAIYSSELSTSKILISKNQALQILYLNHHVYYYYLNLTQQLTHLITGQPP